MPGPSALNSTLGLRNKTRSNSEKRALRTGAGGEVGAQVDPLKNLVSLKLNSDFDFV